MKKLTLETLYRVFLFAFIFTTLSGCSVIGDIFKTGYWLGIISVIAIVGIILYLVFKFSNSSKEGRS
jgi:uncharacterized membrane protein YkvI